MFLPGMSMASMRVVRMEENLCSEPRLLAALELFRGKWREKSFSACTLLYEGVGVGGGREREDGRWICGFSEPLGTVFLWFQQHHEVVMATVECCFAYHS